MFHVIKKLLKPRYVYRSSVTGLFVSKAFAEAHPETTTRERV
jgi:hypothetical protein